MIVQNEIWLKKSDPRAWTGCNLILSCVSHVHGLTPATNLYPRQPSQIFSPVVVVFVSHHVWFALHPDQTQTHWSDYTLNSNLKVERSERNSRKFLNKRRFQVLNNATNFTLSSKLAQQDGWIIVNHIWLKSSWARQRVSVGWFRHLLWMPPANIWNPRAVTPNISDLWASLAYVYHGCCEKGLLDGLPWKVHSWSPDDEVTSVIIIMSQQPRWTTMTFGADIHAPLHVKSSSPVWSKCHNQTYLNYISYHCFSQQWPGGQTLEEASAEKEM